MGAVASPATASRLAEHTLRADAWRATLDRTHHDRSRYRRGAIGASAFLLLTDLAARSAPPRRGGLPTCAAERHRRCHAGDPSSRAAAKLSRGDAIAADVAKTPAQKHADDRRPVAAGNQRTIERGGAGSGPSRADHPTSARHLAATPAQRSTARRESAPRPAGETAPTAAADVDHLSTGRFRAAGSTIWTAGSRVDQIASGSAHPHRATRIVRHAEHTPVCHDAHLRFHEAAACHAETIAGAASIRPNHELAAGAAGQRGPIARRPPTAAPCAGRSSVRRSRCQGGAAHAKPFAPTSHARRAWWLAIKTPHRPTRRPVQRVALRCSGGRASPSNLRRLRAISADDLDQSWSFLQ